MTALRQVFYVSRAAAAVGPNDIARILQASRSNNQRHDITGCLLYSGEHFAQTLEGSVAALDVLLPKIRTDSRHFEFVTLVDCETSIRKYPNWAMGYLYKLDLRDRIETLLQRKTMSGGDAGQLIDEMKVDSVMGSL